MDKTFKQYLEDRIAELVKEYEQNIVDEYELGETVCYYQIKELKLALQEYNNQCTQILEADRKCIKFLDSIRDYERENGQMICHDERTSEELYNEYTKKGAESSTEDSSSS